MRRPEPSRHRGRGRNANPELLNVKVATQAECRAKALWTNRDA